MLEVEVPQVILNLNNANNLADLIKNYLDEPAQKEKKELVNSIINQIDNILKCGNPVLTIEGYTATGFEHFIYEYINTSDVLIIALLRPDFYELLKSSSLKKSWDELLKCCKPPKQYESIQSPRYIPYPHMHSLDILISNFLYNKYLEEKSNNSEISFIKSLPLLAYAAAYGAFQAIEEAVIQLYTYFSKNKNGNYRAELIDFFLKLLDESSKAYLHLGLRLRGCYLIELGKLEMNDSETLSKANENFMTGIKSLLIACKLEQGLADITNPHVTNTIPVIQKGLFALPKKIRSCDPDLIAQFNIITHNAELDGYYHRSSQNFERIDPSIYYQQFQNTIYEKALHNFLRKNNDNVIDTNVQQIFESPTSLISILNDCQSPKP